MNGICQCFSSGDISFFFLEKRESGNAGSTDSILKAQSEVVNNARPWLLSKPALIAFFSPLDKDESLKNNSYSQNPFETTGGINLCPITEQWTPV